MLLKITINIPKEKVELLKKYNYDFERNCEARILYDWQDTYNTEDEVQRRKNIWDKTHSLSSINNLQKEKANN